MRKSNYSQEFRESTIKFCIDNSYRGHNRKRKLLYGRSHLSSKSSKILNVKNPRFLHSI